MNLLLLTTQGHGAPPVVPEPRRDLVRLRGPRRRVAEVPMADEADARPPHGVTVGAGADPRGPLDDAQAG